jgi:hypothetical protein
MLYRRLHMTKNASGTNYPKDIKLELSVLPPMTQIFEQHVAASEARLSFSGISCIKHLFD